jgi:glucose/arabinose dehydrogenase
MRRVGARAFFLVLTLIIGFTATRAASCQTRERYEAKKAFPNLTFSTPIDLQSPKSGDSRLFIAEQSGKIYAFRDRGSVSTKELYLDLSGVVSQGGDEVGLLGFTFHPSYKDNGYLYVNYTVSSPSLRTVIARYQRGATNSLVADPDSGFEILSFSQPYSNHNGGQIAFGRDGYLYIASGDGGSAGDPDGNGQDLGVLLGKILRINVDETSGELNYSIPSSNPFVGVSGAREEIYAYGLRNPWRFSFDSTTGKLWAGDVGQDSREEINIIRKGGNYGWNIREGKDCFSESLGCSKTGKIDPIFDYSHSVGQSVTGGYVYRGRRFSSLRGKYVFADFVTGKVWALSKSGGRWRSTTLSSTGLFISAFGLSRTKELLLLSYADGSIYKLGLR